MSNESLRQANNVKAGVFVSAALVVGLIVIFLLGNLWTLFFGPPMNTYRTQFSVLNGVGYLQTGSEVRIGGIKVGQVESVSFKESQASPIEIIDVSFTIPQSMSLYSNAVASVKSGIISADSFIAISSVGFDESNRPTEELGDAGLLLKPGDEFEGTGAGGMLVSILGPKAGGDVEAFLDNLEFISSNMRTDGYVLRWVLGAPSAEEIQHAVVSIDKVVGDFQKKWDASWSNEVSSILAKLDSSMTNVDELLENNRESVDEIVSDIKEITNKANETWSPQLTAIFSDGQSALDNLDQVMADLKNRSPLMFDNFGDMLANLNVGSQQLNRAIAEVSSSPWRLLYRPTDKEYSNELLYEAARNFSFGAADLKSAAGSMQRLLDARGDSLGPEDEDLVLIRRNLVESFQRYEEAQQQLMEILRGSGSTGATGQADDGPGGSNQGS